MNITVSEIIWLSRLMVDGFSARKSLEGCLNGVIQQSENPDLTTVITDIRDTVLSGNSLSRAFAQYPDVFDKNYVAMIRQGEQKGNLDVVLQSYCS